MKLTFEKFIAYVIIFGITALLVAEFLSKAGLTGHWPMGIGALFGMCACLVASSMEQ